MSPRAYTPEQELDMAVMFTDGSSIAELQRKYGGSYPSARAALKRQGAYEVRPGGHYGGKKGVHQRTFTGAEVDEMVHLWDMGLSKRGIAIAFKTTTYIVERELLACGISPIYRDGVKRGPESSRWKGGRFVRDDGYVVIRTGDGHYRFEHRLVMEKKLGRKLTRSETVHHINGDKQDNIEENLQLRQGKHGTGNVVTCIDCGSTNVGPVPIA